MVRHIEHLLRGPAMSLVAFPFKTERVDVIVHNIEIAATHERVEQVLCVGFEEEETFRAIDEVRSRVTAETGKPVHLILQDRIGDKRAGKGDGMNSALDFFLGQTDLERIHFFDSDITSFGPDWISRAEEAADLDFDVVRHYFPRASTDAMITWLITRCGFAIQFPRTELPWIEQPLGGELLFKRPVAASLVADERVRAQSDWGIDTLYTFATVQSELPLFETYAPQGKAHKLYGRLTDLRTMLVECFAALQGLSGEEVPEYIPHRVEPPAGVPEEIASKIGFDFESTLALLTERWTEGQQELLELFPTPIRDGMLANMRRPRFGFMGEDEWFETIQLLLARFDASNHDWRELLFKLWTTRVLNYTTTQALRGYGPAQRYRRSTLDRYARRAAFQQ
jgi:mannosylglycerate synthase